MEKVLQPLNEKAASIIAEHIDLLDAQHVVPELLQLVAHVSAMRVILHRWAAVLPAECSWRQQQPQVLLGVDRIVLTKASG